MFSALPHAFYYVFFPLLFYAGKRRLLFYAVKETLTGGVKSLL